MTTTHKRTFTCPCKKATTLTLQGMGCYSVGEALEKAPGWKYALKVDGHSFWLCPDCSKKAFELAEQMVNIVGTTEFYFKSFVTNELKEKFEPR